MLVPSSLFRYPCKSSAGIHFYLRHPRRSLAGIHPTRNPDRFPINNVGNDDGGMDARLKMSGMTTVGWLSEIGHPDPFGKAQAKGPAESD
ncbi:MAG: hypothetical protein H0X47_11120 [Nitrospirales bacterium]|nr:hypothetical protein [Nitrospirales bacterium]